MEEKSELDKMMEEIDIRNSIPILGWFYTHGWFSYNFIHLFKHPWEIIEGIYSEIEWAWQRVFRGWDDRVIWSIDTYLCEMMPQWLEKLKHDKHGIPMVMFHDEDFDKGNNHHTSPEIDEIRSKEYDEILDQISDAFKAHMTLYNKYPVDPIQLEKYNKGMDLFKIYFGTLWD